jgi:hypothetical protein
LPTSVLETPILTFSPPAESPDWPEEPPLPPSSSSSPQATAVNEASTSNSSTAIAQGALRVPPELRVI